MYVEAQIREEISKLHAAGLCEGSPPVTRAPRRPATRKMFPFGDVVVHLMSPNSIKNIYRCGLAHTYIKYISPHILIHIYVHTRRAPHDTGETVSWKHTHTKKTQKKTNNTRRHWRHHRLSWWQPTEPPAKTKIIKPTTSRSIACLFSHRRTRGYIHIYTYTYLY